MEYDKPHLPFCLYFAMLRSNSDLSSISYTEVSYIITCSMRQLLIMVLSLCAIRFTSMGLICLCTFANCQPLTHRTIKYRLFISVYRHPCHSTKTTPWNYSDEKVPGQNGDKPKRRKSKRRHQNGDNPKRWQYKGNITKTATAKCGQNGRKEQRTAKCFKEVANY